MSDSMPRPTGRGVRRNVPNRFERLHVEVDPAALDDEERASVETVYLRDPSASILSQNESPDIPFTYSLNPYKGCEHGCPYCYARPSHEYWGLSAGLDFETTIFVKEDAPRLLGERLQSTGWTPEAISMSGNTDPYQPVERELEITRSCLEVFSRHRHPVSIVTKSGLIRRDTDLLADLANRNLVSVCMSMTSVDDAMAGKLEPRAARPSLRLKTIEALAEAGVPTGVLVAPVIPGLNDEEIPRILEAAADRGARFAGYVLLRLPGPVAELFTDWIEEHFPDRTTRILGRLRSMRDGALTDTGFGRRMRGRGEWASVLSQLFHSARRRHDLARSGPTLRTDAFRRLPNGQRSLF